MRSFLQRTTVLVLMVVPVLNSHADGEGTVPVRPVAATRVREADDGPQRMREGSRLNDVAGHFDFAGDRIAFFPADGKESFRVLENLALERVSRILGESRTKPQWTVSGTITEYRGLNYLLVTRATIQSTPPPTP
jgi:hypothetical protein